MSIGGPAAPRRGARALLAEAAWKLSPTGSQRVHRLLRESEWWSANELDALRLEALRHVLEAATAVPFYRERLRASGVSPEDIRSIADLSAIPPLERAELQREGIQGLARSGAEGRVRRTSGSIGRPVVVLRPPVTRAWSAALYRRFHESLGVYAGERQLGVFTYSPRGGRSRLRHIPPNFKAVHRFELTDPRLLRGVLRSLERRPPALVGGFSTGLYYLATLLSAAGQTFRAKACWSGGNVLRDHHRPAIERAFGCEVYQRYACEEVGTIAHECPEERSLHVAAETMIVEVVDDAGRPALPGHAGHVLVTDLRNDAMPFIRYRIGDKAVPPRDSSCPCGRSLPVLGMLIGRSNDALVKSDGTVLLPGFITQLMEDVLESVLEYRVLQHPDLSVAVSVVQRDDPAPDEIRKMIASRIDELVALPGATRVQRVDETTLMGVEKLRHISSEASPRPGASSTLSAGSG